MRTLRKLNQQFYKASYQDIAILDENGDATGETKKAYSNPILYRASISATSTLPEEIDIGLIPDYDRFITIFHHSIVLNVGDLLYVDRALNVNQSGEITNKPDYVVVRVISTQSGEVDRYGIKRLANDD